MKSQKRSLIIVILYVLLSAAKIGGQSIDGRLQNVTENNSNDLSPASDGSYYVFEDNTIKMYCYCTNDVQNAVVSLEITHQDIGLASVESCAILMHVVTINELNQGRYECRARHRNGVIQRAELGNVRIYRIDDHISAPGLQFGLLDALATLNCSSTANITSIILRNSRDIVIIDGRITSVTLDHEGQYMCELFLTLVNLIVLRPIQFKVIVPPHIMSSPQDIINFTSNHRQSLAVIFKSKYGSQTRISWYKNGRAIQDTLPGRNDTFDDYSNSSTQLVLDPIRRSDNGVYRVVIENNHTIIPSSRRRVEVTFTVLVTILPARPTSLTAHNRTSHSAYLTWELNGRTTDDVPTKQVVQLTFHNKTVAFETELFSGETELMLSLAPNTRYTAQITSFNQDGSAISDESIFYTLVGAPFVSGVSIARVSGRNDTLHLEASLSYIGGADIVSFRVSFRYIGTEQWMVLSNPFPASQASNSALVWSADVVIQHKRFQNCGVELSIEAVNNEGYHSQAVEQRETIVLPGAPLSVEVVSSNYDSAVLILELPLTGTTPFTHMEVEFHSPDSYVVNITILTSLELGNMKEVILPDLQDGTVYLISVSIYNCGGKGGSSQQIEVTTLVRPPLAVYGIALVSVCGAILLVTMVITAVVIGMKCSYDKRKEREYIVTGDKPQPLTPAHPIAKHGTSSSSSPTSPLSPISPSPPTPSTATSILSPRQSPPGFYHSYSSTPPVCNAPPNGVGHTSFKFDEGGVRRTSINQDSDISESNSPRYTYTFPRSSETTPHVRRAYDQVDLPHDIFDYIRPTSEGHTSHAYMGTEHLSLSRNGLATSRVFTNMDSRAQSTHSVATTATRLTTDTISTRESLLFPQIETNTTDV